MSLTKRVYYCPNCAEKFTIHRADLKPDQRLENLDHPPCVCKWTQVRDITHVVQLEDYVGVLTQHLFPLTLKPDGLREIWSQSLLDAHAEEFRADAPFALQDRMGDHYREDGRYQDTLTKYVNAAQGWPSFAGYRYPLWALTPAEKQIVENYRVGERRDPPVFLYALQTVDGSEGGSVNDILTYDFDRLVEHVENWTTNPCIIPVPDDWKETILTELQTIARDHHTLARDRETSYAFCHFAFTLTIGSC